MISVGFATNDWSQTWLDPDGTPVIGGAGHYRCAMAAQALRLAGNRTALGVLVGKKDTGEMGVKSHGQEAQFGFEVLVVQRFMHARLAEGIRRARAGGQIVINDVDDWWDGLDPGNAAFMTTSPKFNQDENRDHYRRALVASDLITCSTPFLVDRMSKLGDARLVRNRIDLGAWKPSEAAERPLTAGWVGATPWRSAGDLESLRGVLGPFLGRHDGWAYHGGHRWGDRPFAERVGIDPRRCSYRPMVTVADYPSLFDGFDVGLVPLANKPFNEAKSAIKGMEYAAAGIPFVAAATSEYSWLASLGIGRVARRPRDWIRHLEVLAELGPEGRAAEARFGFLRLGTLDSSGLAGEWVRLLADVGLKAA